jgi:pyruvate/2-oxoglutarate dehydrogenase complex dihydrolipoamide dehydrogenase (E3) component
MAENPFDVAIVGAGQAGIPLAIDLGKAGRRVALVEREHLGGSCVNFGCTPTKAALASARVAHLARRASDFGLRIRSVEVDFAAVIRRAREAALGMRQSLDEELGHSSNVRLVRAHAKLEGRDGELFRLRAGGEALVARQVVLDTGTRTRIPLVEGLAQVPYLHSENWLSRDRLPERLVIVGGGYIGLEMGQFYARMGSRVTILEDSDRVVSREDQDVSEELRAILHREGVSFRVPPEEDRIA